jgi:hypothetical protein
MLAPFLFMGQPKRRGGMVKTILICFLFLSVTGCATAPYQAPSPNVGQCIWDGSLQYTCNNYEVEIISGPPGAKIEINNEYVGETPVTKVWNGRYSEYDSYTVTAYPKQAGQYVQTKSIRFESSGELYCQVTLPKKIYFDMNLGPTTPSFDVNVNNQN